MIRLLIIILIIILIGVSIIPNFIISLFINDETKIYKFYCDTVRLYFKIVLFVAGVKVKVFGIDNIESFDKNEPLFIISNHRGYFDIVAGYTVINRNCSIIAKESLKKVPVISYYMKKIKSLFLNRKDLRSGAKMVIDAINLIKQNISVWVFPEGTRNKNINQKELLEFKAGTFKIPEKTNCYIVPMAILNSDDVFEKHFPVVKSTTLYINVGNPYKIEELDENEKNNIADYSRNIMIKLLNELIMNKE